MNSVVADRVRNVMRDDKDNLKIGKNTNEPQGAQQGGNSMANVNEELNNLMDGLENEGTELNDLLDGLEQEQVHEEETNFFDEIKTEETQNTTDGTEEGKAKKGKTTEEKEAERQANEAKRTVVGLYKNDPSTILRTRLRDYMSKHSQFVCFGLRTDSYPVIAKVGSKKLGKDGKPEVARKEGDKEIHKKVFSFKMRQKAPTRPLTMFVMVPAKAYDVLTDNRVTADIVNKILEEESPEMKLVYKTKEEMADFVIGYFGKDGLKQSPLTFEKTGRKIKGVAVATSEDQVISAVSKAKKTTKKKDNAEQTTTTNTLVLKIGNSTQLLNPKNYVAQQRVKVEPLTYNAVKEGEKGLVYLSLLSKFLNFDGDKGNTQDASKFLADGSNLVTKEDKVSSAIVSCENGKFHSPLFAPKNEAEFNTALSQIKLEDPLKINSENKPVEIAQISFPVKVAKQAKSGGTNYQFDKSTLQENKVVTNEEGQKITNTYAVEDVNNWDAIVKATNGQFNYQVYSNAMSIKAERKGKALSKEEMFLANQMQYDREHNMIRNEELLSRLSDLN